jgi:primosomal protein N' (replication factor Y)
VILDNVAGKFAKMMRESFNNRVLGPEYPVVSKVRNYYVKNVLLKVEVTRSFLKAKKIVLYILDHMKENKMLDRCIVQIDIDPN